MIKIFYGDDTFSISKEIELITEKTEKDQGIVITIKPEGIENLESELFMVSFFKSKKLFVIKNCISILPESLKNSLKTKFDKIPERTSLIFVEKSLDPKSTFVNWLKKNSEIKVFNNQIREDPKIFIKRRFKEAGIDIAPLAIERLSDYAGKDFWRLSEEIKKLILYKKSNEIDQCVSSSDIDQLVKPDIEKNIFDLVDAIATKNIKRSSDLIYEFLDSGEKALYLLTMISKQISNIAMAKFESELSEYALSKKAFIHPYVAKKTIAQSRNYSKEDVLEMYKKIAWADLKLKSGHEPSQVLTRIII